jgi:hypothetical protein
MVAKDGTLDPTFQVVALDTTMTVWQREKAHLLVDWDSAALPFQNANKGWKKNNINSPKYAGLLVEGGDGDHQVKDTKRYVEWAVVHIVRDATGLHVCRCTCLVSDGCCTLLPRDLFRHNTKMSSS